MIYFTSDLHFGHANVLKFDNRPFSSIEEMDTELIKRWNDKVKNEDTVYVLGDIIWKASNAYVTNVLNSLNGKIVLIKGNHDNHLVKDKRVRSKFADVLDYADINVQLTDGSIRRCILSHYFIPFYNGHRHNAIHLHGHSHVTEEHKLELQIADELNQKGLKNQIYNVGCMHWNYEPVTLDEILNNTKKIKP